MPGQCFTEPCPAPPSELFRRLRERNPSPYGFLINLGAATTGDGGTAPEGEWLVGASPEMLVREIAQSVQETFPRNVRVSSETAADLLMISADASQLHRVLLNLAVNARDAMPSGGKTGRAHV